MKYCQIAAMMFLVTSVLKGEVAMGETIPAEIKKVVTFIFPADARGNLLPPG